MTSPARHALLAAIALAAMIACARTGTPPAQLERAADGTDGASSPAANATSGVATAASVSAGTTPATPGTPPQAPAASFRFVAWGDTKIGSSVSAGAALQGLSEEARALTPPASFTLYLGDLEEWGFSDAGGQTGDWAARLNGGTSNGTSLITFASRGNHDALDAGSTATWQSYFDFAAVARNVGATQYAALDPQITYSFDFGNAHFVSLDAPGDFPYTVTSRQLTWLEQDLAAAEARGLAHAFLYWHGPIYTVTGTHALDNVHPDQAIRDLVAIAGRHPIVSAVLNGHEHVLAYNHIGPARFPSLAFAHEFEEFTIGSGGAAYHDPLPGRGDAVLPYVPAFATIDVSGRTFTVNWYALGSGVPQSTFTFTKP